MRLFSEAKQVAVNLFTMLYAKTQKRDCVNLCSKSGNPLFCASHFAFRHLSVVLTKIVLLYPTAQLALPRALVVGNFNKETGPAQARTVRIDEHVGLPGPFSRENEA